MVAQDAEEEERVVNGREIKSTNSIDRPSRSPILGRWFSFTYKQVAGHAVFPRLPPQTASGADAAAAAAALPISIKVHFGLCKRKTAPTAIWTWTGSMRNFLHAQRRSDNYPYYYLYHSAG